jgi:exopolysaccharide biosynthesis polyprenyl glycosylphosphotransferase
VAVAGRTPFAPAPAPAARDWRIVYARRLLVTDFLVLGWVVFGVQIAWFGVDSSNLAFRGDLGMLAVNYSVISVLLIVSWMIMLGVFGSRGYRVLGTGPEEYKLILDASIRLFGIVAIIAFLGKIDFARGYVLIAFPLGLAVLAFSRWIWRQWLGVQRLRGTYSSRVVLMGSEESAVRIASVLHQQSSAGYLVVGACLPKGVAGSILGGGAVPVLGDFNDIGAALDAVGADTVVVTSNEQISALRMRELSWSLEPGRHHLVVAPSLTGIGGPRIHTRPVAGLPLIHVETPRYEGSKQFAKRAFDILASGLLIVVLSPLLAIITLCVRWGTPGMVLFRQERVGINGSTFTMLKFRSMVHDAEALLAALQDEQRLEGNTVMFKMAKDPRITRVGRVLRRFSLDELPQLFNVFAGSMSLVGPRPPLPGEVQKYETHVHRRFLVKPGITGLWQISGRSNLSWEDTVRLDLFYVENWSIASDLIILWRTAKAVVGRDGAY